MTHNIFVKCDVCGCIIDLKWQIGYLPKSIFKVNCGRCKTVIEGYLYTNNKPGFNYEIKNAKEINEKFDVDCDYIIPISGEILTEKMMSGEEQFRSTPFINMISLIGVENFSRFNDRFLNGMEKIDLLKEKCNRINELYLNKEYKYLKKMLKDDFDITIKKYNENNIMKEKLNVDILFFESFVIEDFFVMKDKMHKNYKKIRATNKKEYEKLLNFVECDIEKNERKIREVLNLFVEKYNCFIPILILEYVKPDKRINFYNNYAITTVNFEEIRNMYLKIYENVINASTIIIGLNNIMYREKYDCINNAIINKKNSIQDYIDMSKGNRIKFLEQNEFFNITIPNFDKDIRNAIGHEDIEYDAFHQKLKFDEKEESLMEYVFNIWNCYKCCLLLYEIILNIKLDIIEIKNKLNKNGE